MCGGGGGGWEVGKRDTACEPSIYKHPTSMGHHKNCS